MGLAGNDRYCCCPSGRTAFRRAGLEPARRFRALPRSNRHLHHRQADALASAVDGYAGERAISAFSDDNTVAVLTDESCAGPRANLFRGRIPVRVSKAGGIPAVPCGRSIRHLHHQRRLSRDDSGKPSYENSIAALSTRRMLRTLRVRSAIGVRLIASFPPAGPARLGTRVLSASPEIRVSRSGDCRDVRSGRAAGNKKPSGAAGSGGSRSGLSILRSSKIAPMSRACAVE